MATFEAEPLTLPQDYIKNKIARFLPTPDENRLLTPYPFTPQIIAINGQYEHTDSSNGVLIVQPDKNNHEHLLIDPGSNTSFPYLLANIALQEAKTSEIDPRLSDRETYRQLLQSGLQKIKKILLTHIHPDHSGSVRRLLSAIRKSGGDAEVYAPQGAIDEMNHPDWHHVGELFYPGIELEYFVIHHELDEKPVVLGDVEIQPVYTPGHEPNHRSYRVSTTDGQSILVVGDAIAGGFSKKIGSSLPEYRDTYDLLHSLSIDNIYEAHGNPTKMISREILRQRKERLAHTEKELEPGGFAGTLKAQL